MARLSYGPSNWHIMSSNGPSTHSLEFYSTCYSTVHGKQTVHSDKVLRHRGTGYDANFRPTIYYSKQVDALDNPAMSQLLIDNYSTTTRRFFTPYLAPKGNEHLPVKVYSGLSGFSTSSLNATPMYRDGSTCSPTATESRSNYYIKPSNHEIKPSIHATKAESGFTHASRTTSVIPHEGYEWDRSPRQHIKSHVVVGTLPGVCSSDCSNGFVKGQAHDSRVQPRASEKIGYSANLHPIPLSRTQKQDPAEYSSIVAPDQYLSLTRYSQLCAHPKIMSRIEIGRNVHTGFTENNVPSVDLRGNGPAELCTTYRAVHGAGTAREVRSCGGVRPAVSDGFTKSTRVHQFGPLLNTGALLRKQDPYVARSIMRRDPCFDDRTHDRKLHC